MRAGLVESRRERETAEACSWAVCLAHRPVKFWDGFFLRIILHGNEFVQCVQFVRGRFNHVVYAKPHVMVQELYDPIKIPWPLNSDILSEVQF